MTDFLRYRKPLRNLQNIFFIGVLLGFILAAVLSTSSTQAQIPDSWSPRQRIPGSHDLAKSPYMVADSNRTVHAFLSQPSLDDDSDRAIFYSRWTAGLGWTMPNNIIIPPVGTNASIKGAFLDGNGVMHIIFYVGEDRADIFYSRALAVDANRSSAWSEPLIIGKNAIVDTAALTGDDQGNLFVVYGGDLGVKGVYAVHSKDGGDSWSEPTAVYLTYDDELFAFGIQLHRDRTGRLHSVWAVNNLSGSGQAIYYAGTDSDFESWSKPIVLAKVGQADGGLSGGLIDRVVWPSITSKDDGIILIYTVCSECERRMRRSFDGGETWSPPIEPFMTRGDYGHARFIVDSNNTLHMILGDRARGHTLWHSVWQADRWQEPSPIIPVSERLLYERGDLDPRAYNPQRPQVVISQGNVILVSWEQDAGNCCNGAWYTYTTIDVPEIPVVALPAPTATPTFAPTALNTASMPEQTPTVDVSLSNPINLAQIPNSTPAIPLLISVVVTSVLIAVTIIYFVFKKS
jgi:hypothetical protein